MAVTKFTDAQIFLGGRNMSGKHNSVSVDYSAEMLDATVFGMTTKGNVAGLLDWSVSAEGFWDAGTDVPATGVTFVDSAGADAPFNIMGGAERVLTLAPSGADAGTAFLLKVAQSDYSFFGGVGDAIPFSYSHAPTQYGTRGFIALPATQRVASANGNALTLGTLTSAQRLVATLHLVQFNGTSLDVVIQSDDNGPFGSPTSRITFTQMTAIGAQWGAVAGPITPDNLFRASCTFVGTSFTALVAIGVQSIT